MVSLEKGNRRVKKCVAILLEFVLGFVLLSYGSLLMAQAKSDPLKQLMLFNQQTQSLSGQFVQQAKTNSSGNFLFKRPGRFVWDVTKPYSQQLVSNGQQLYWYDKDIEQVVVRPLKNALEDSPVALLFGTGVLSDLFKLEVVQTQEGGHAVEWVQGTPKQTSAFYKTVRISFENNLPKVLVLEDQFGKETRIEFSGLKANVAIDEKKFEFKIPPNASVIQDSKK